MAKKESEECKCKDVKKHLKSDMKTFEKEKKDDKKLLKKMKKRKHESKD